MAAAKGLARGVTKVSEASGRTLVSGPAEGAAHEAMLGVLRGPAGKD